MDYAINKFKLIDNQLVKLKLSINDLNILQTMFNVILDPYNFNSNLKNELIHNMDFVLLVLDRFNKIINHCVKNNITNTYEHLNKNIYPNDEIGIKIKNINDVLLNYIIEQNILNKPNEISSIGNTDETDTIINDDLSSIGNTDETESIINDELFNIDYLRDNQKLAINKMIEQKFVSGVNCQIMGAGKSIIILNTIQTHYDILKKNKLYIICTERIDILKKLLLEPIYQNNRIIDYKLNQTNISIWKNNGVINMDLFVVINYLTNKNFNVDDLIPNDKPILLIVNNAFLKSQNNYKKINRSNIGLILVDECHLISGSKNYEMFKWFKYGNNLICPIIGFSATPLRETKKSANQLSDIFSNSLTSSTDNKLNLISNYTLIDGLTDRIVLPFKHILIENRSEDKIVQTRNVGKDLIKEIFCKYVLTNDELPFKKGVCWDRLLKNIPKNKSIIENITNEYEIFEHHSQTQNDNEFEDFCASPNNCLLLCVNCCKEGSDIKNLDYGLYLDGVKKRSFVVSMQTAGRIMRPDENKLKKYAYIIEVLHASTDENKISVEAMTVNKLISYYKSILNLGDDNKNNIDYNLIGKQFMDLYNATYINEIKNEVEIQIGVNVEPCIIKFDMKTIDWSKFREYLDQHVKKISGDRIEDQFKIIVDKLKKIPEFQKDSDFEMEYMNLDYKQLGIPQLDELKNRYKSTFDTKTWYDILGLHFDYYSLEDLRIYLQDNGYNKINQKIYDKLKKKNIRMAIYPFQYYKKSNVCKYENLMTNVNYIII